MKSKLLISSVASIAVSLFGAGSAQAFMISGWDFSQYAGDGLLSIDGATGTGTADSNYSDFVPQDPGGAAFGFGTMYLDGQFGSTNSPLDITNDPFVPFAGSLTTNLDAPAGDPFGTQVLAGQSFINPLSMTARNAAIVVFEADLTSVPEQGSAWSISFGGKTSTGTTGVGVEFSNDGVNFVSFGSVNFTSTDTAFSVVFGGVESEKAYARFSFDPNVAGLQQAFLDNVAFNATLVPEPGTAALLLVGLAGLGLAGRRRSA